MCLKKEIIVLLVLCSDITLISKNVFFLNLIISWNNIFGKVTRKRRHSLKILIRRRRMLLRMCAIPDSASRWWCSTKMTSNKNLSRLYIPRLFYYNYFVKHILWSIHFTCRKYKKQQQHGSRCVFVGFLWFWDTKLQSSAFFSPTTHTLTHIGLREHPVHDD